MKVLTIGSLNVDHVYAVDSFVQPGQTKHVRSLSTASGGKGLNQSIACARAGLPTAHLGQVGSDGQLLLDELAMAGVDVLGVRKVDGPSGHAIIQVDATGQNCILVYGGPNQELRLEDVVAALDSLEPDDVVLLQNETNLVAETLELAAVRGLPVALNPSPIAGAENLPLEAVRWLFVNEGEGAALAGASEPDAILDALAERLPQTEVVLTLGAEGGVWSHDGIREHQAAHTTTVVDTTAAGDTFTGYFLRGVLDPVEGFSPLELASAASALAISRPGAAPSIPSIDEVLALLRG